MSDYCKHGKRLLTQPVKKCSDCDYEEEIQSLTAENERLRGIILKCAESLDEGFNDSLDLSDNK